MGSLVDPGRPRRGGGGGRRPRDGGGWGPGALRRRDRGGVLLDARVAGIRDCSGGVGHRWGLPLRVCLRCCSAGRGGGRAACEEPPRKPALAASRGQAASEHLPTGLAADSLLIFASRGDVRTWGSRVHQSCGYAVQWVVPTNRPTAVAKQLTSRPASRPSRAPSTSAVNLAEYTALQAAMASTGSTANHMVAGSPPAMVM